LDTLSVPQEEVQVLIHLGLTFSQARVYIALVRSGASAAKTISKASKVAREDIYRIMPKLQELGLVEKIIEAPSMYAAVPIRDAFTILMESRKQETSELQAKTKEIIQNFNNNNIGTTLEEEMHEFVLMPKERAVVKRKQMIDGAQKRIDFLTSWQRFTQSNVSYAASLRNALKKNVEIRFIVGKPQDEKSMLELVQPWREKYPCYNARWIPRTPHASLMLVDDQKVLFANSAATSLKETPFLWSINQSLVSVVQDYFEMMWTTSSEIKAKNMM
jgi:sugar-specific transcriptional regulator TrmB